MPTRITYLDYANPDSVGITPLDISLTERAIYNHPGLVRWLRADTGIPADGTKWYCRKSGVALSATGAPTVTVKSTYNNQKVVTGDGSNYFSLPSGFFPPGNIWSAIVVGAPQDTGITASRRFFKTITADTGGYAEPSWAVYRKGTGLGIGGTPVNLTQGPFIGVWGDNFNTNRQVARSINKAGAQLNRDRFPEVNSPGVANDDTSIRIPFTVTAGQWIDGAEWMFFNTMIMDETAMYNTILAYLKARYAYP